jgi:hypothetical protein
VKTLPILFSGPLVRKILAGEKSQTRRLMKPEPSPDTVAWTYIVDSTDRARSQRFVPRRATFGDAPPHLIGEKLREAETGPPRRSPYGLSGDHLYVREAFALSVRDQDEEGRDVKDPTLWDPPIYRATDEGKGEWTNAEGETVGPKWRPSIHMPRWASRITLEVTEVRVERLQDISTEDIVAEGVEVPDVDFRVVDDPRTLEAERDEWARDAFERLWESINSKRASWASNPWVWCISFRRVEGN